jgi:hypothetical protein
MYRVHDPEGSHYKFAQDEGKDSISNSKIKSQSLIKSGTVIGA